jgi:hypothetical protein
MPRIIEYHESSATSACVALAGSQDILSEGTSSGDGEWMPRRTIIMMIFAILVGIVASVATYHLITSSQHDHKVDRGSDSPGPLF